MLPDGHLESNWQVKTQGFKKVKSHPTIAIKPKHLAAFYEMYQSSQQKYGFYLVLGKARHEIDEIVQQPPHERFEWYVVDMFVYIEKNKERIKEITSSKKGITIRFSKDDRFDLHSCSLLWAHLWVKKYFYPLNDVIMGSFDVFHKFNVNPQMLIGQGKLIDQDAQKKVAQVVSSIVAQGEDLSDHERNLLNMINSIYDINTKVKQKDILKISNYCPESLSGNLTLWIMSRLYRSYMIATSGSEEQTRVKHLPVSTTFTFPVYRYSLFLVKKIYEAFGVIVFFLDQDAIPNSHDDRGWYSDGIGVFPWMNVLADGSISFQTIAAGDESEVRDFLHEAPWCAISAPRMSDEDLLSSLGINIKLTKDIDSFSSVPKWLVNECYYTCHPFEGILN